MINYTILYANIESFADLFDEMNRIDDGRRALATLIGQSDDIQTHDCQQIQTLLNLLQDHQDSLSGRLYQLYVKSPCFY